MSKHGFRALCRDCGWRGPGGAPDRCPGCGSPRVLSNPELSELAIAHVDCDAFYAAVEKRDDPRLLDKPVIIGGGRRGVVSTACYVARIYGVRSAMPMFKALEQCPNAVVLKPDMAKYVAVSREIRAMMTALTPLVEPLSLDEAFLDLSGTERIHRRRPVETLVDLQERIEREIGVSVSVGLAPNKFLAKIASELDKPRGFAAIAAGEAEAFLEGRPIEVIWGVGAATAGRLRADGIGTIGDLKRFETAELMKRYGAIGGRLARLARADDPRPVTPRSTPKSVSSETTFDTDLTDAEVLDGHLWGLCEKTADRLKAKSLAGRVVTLKLKTAAFKTVTRRRSMDHPTNFADAIYRTAASLLSLELGPNQRYRLIGVGVSDLRQIQSEKPGSASNQDNFLDLQGPKRRRAEQVIDSLRARFGFNAVQKGRSLR